ncbi:MAG: DUF4184 family protein [Pseudomonadales bacterium]
MPFTVTHTLAVAPIAARWPMFPAAALFIGAMIPDWGLFVPIGPGYTLMHTWLGILLACVPLGLLLLVLFRSLVRRAVVELTPTDMQIRLTKFKVWQTRFTGKEILAASVALAIGAASHLIWDAFTHHGRWGVELLPFMSTVLFEIGDSQVQVFKFIQHGSSAVGLPLLACWAWRWYQSQPVVAEMPPLLSGRMKIGALALIVGIPVVIACRKLWLFLSWPMSPSAVQHFLMDLVTTCGLWFALLLVAYSFSLRLLASVLPPQASQLNGRIESP